jgi:hypothetical protein
MLHMDNPENLGRYFSGMVIVVTEKTDREVRVLEIAQEVSGKWITSVLGALDAVDTATRERILEVAGRTCAHGPKCTVDLASQLAAEILDVKARLERFRETFPIPSHFWAFEVEANRFRSLTFEYRNDEVPCACPLVRTKTIDLNPALCACGHGWVKEHFEALLGHEVRVTSEQTFARGDDCCRFTVHAK